MEQLCDYLQNPDCRLETLSVKGCKLSSVSCASLATALKANPSYLRELDMSSNELQDSGVVLLSDYLGCPDCRLVTLRLAHCSVLSPTSFASLASAFQSNPFHLRELDLRGNHLQDSEVELLRELVESPNYRLETLWIDSECIRADEHLKSLKSKCFLAQSDNTHTDKQVEKGKLNLSDDDEKALVFFTPESAISTYRFRCPGQGVFQCTVTRLVFVMSKESALQYRIVQWEELLLQSWGKEAAGPLYDIKCTEKAVQQLHFPHCETKEALLVDGSLSVVNINEDGTSFLKPLKITDTHVVVDVPHLSVFGLVKWLLNIPSEIKGQVQLFLRRLDPEHEVLDVFLLQHNIVLNEVAAQQGDAKYIRTSSDCLLKCNNDYSVHCEPEGFHIQPEHARFFGDYGPNFYPTFEVFLTSKPEKVTVVVKDKDKKEVWKRVVFLAGPRKEPLQDIVLAQDSTPGLPPVLDRIQFIESVSDPVLNQLLDILLQNRVINDEEWETLKDLKPRADKAREVFDTVGRKGANACSVLHKALSEKDSCLFNELTKFNKLTLA
ncbi:NACHT, LRR and PYD domains-containing protein 1-like [Halichoeres trimaculatus]|uniref:NACHT, LRR and PYD domains-containing protein 1-like n=1 Tax=Halichoeres trimaculatus TaxID=147232 RepID=UPI003D9E6A85